MIQGTSNGGVLKIASLIVRNPSRIFELTICFFASLITVSFTGMMFLTNLETVNAYIEIITQTLALVSTILIGLLLVMITQSINANRYKYAVFLGIMLASLLAMYTVTFNYLVEVISGMREEIAALLMFSGVANIFAWSLLLSIITVLAIIVYWAYESYPFAQKEQRQQF